MGSDQNLISTKPAGTSLAFFILPGDVYISNYFWIRGAFSAKRTEGAIKIVPEAIKVTGLYMFIEGSSEL